MLFRAELCCTVLYCVGLHCTVLYFAVQCCATLYSVVLYGTVSCCVAQGSAVLGFTVLCCDVQYYYRTVLCWAKVGVVALKEGGWKLEYCDTETDSLPFAARPPATTDTATGHTGYTRSNN